MTRRRDPESSATLGLCLGAGRVGIALVCCEHLLGLRVLNLRKVPTASGKEQRFTERVRGLLERYPVSRVVTVTPEGHTGRLVEIQALVLAALLRGRGAVLAEYSPAQVKRALVPEGTRPTHRALALALAERFGQVIHPATRSSTLSGRVPSPSASERYWSRAHLALAATVHDQNEELRSLIDA